MSLIYRHMCTRAEVFQRLSMRVLERGWLSSNNVIFAPADPTAPTALVDSGFASHSIQTVQLLTAALGGRPLDLLLNTHLHSDHAGGNALIQATWPRVQTLVPATTFPEVRRWNEAALTYRHTQQQCDPFRADGALRSGASVSLGGQRWDVVAAPGHDDDAVMLFQPDERVLISGDALWENRVAIVFSALGGQTHGFATAERTLNAIEELEPRWVVPGHGPPFEDASRALAVSRAILRRFHADPATHLIHAARALLVFHLSAAARVSRSEVMAWLVSAPVFQQIANALGEHDLDSFGHAVLSTLAERGTLMLDGEWIRVRSG